MEKLTAEKLFKKIDIDFLNLTSTQDIIPFEDIIGQDRAVKSMNFGLRIKNKGYNIFMAGVTGTGKTSYAKSIVKKIAEEMPTPDDWCYVYNFEQPDEPQAIDFPAGQGEAFAADMETIIKEFKEEIPNILDSEEFENKKREIGQNYQNESNRLLSELDKWSKERGFTIQKTAKGVYLVPVIDGEAADQLKLNSLAEEQTEEIQQKLPEVQKEFDKVLRKIRSLEKNTYQEIENLEKEYVLLVIEPELEKLKSIYTNNIKVINYLDAVQKDIINNLEYFKKPEEDSNTLSSIFPGDKKEDFFKRYKVNIFINNAKTVGAPVIIESNPTYYNLFGKIEGKPQFATITMDFTDIKSGSIHQANGGFLVIYALDILKEPFSWDTLKRVIQNEKSIIENIGEQFKLYPTETLKPEPIPINIKVIMIGSSYVYRLLYQYDEGFRKLFKIKSQFDNEMKLSKDNIEKYAAFISSICKREKLLHFDKSAVESVIEYSMQLTEDQNKLSTRFNEVAEIIYESSTWAALDNKQFVTAEYVKKAISEKEYRHSLLEEKIQELIENGDILINIEGEVVGQVNGLSVYHTGDYSFGRPSRITAQTFLGDAGVVNIEREVKLSGNIHDKGILILSGYLGNKYGKDIPLTLTASLCFEQSYGGVDGDSASCAELAALLSSISNIPIKQSYAVTGSLNQKGEIQPIGKVNEKIKGFFEVCKAKGFKGEKGVIIPEQNVKNLMLNEEIISAVKNNSFVIYSVKYIDEILELLMGMPAKKIHKSVQEKLIKMYEDVKRHGNE